MALNIDSPEYQDSLINQQLSERKEFDKGTINLSGKVYTGTLTRIIDNAAIFVADNNQGSIAIDLTDFKSINT